MEKKFVCKLCDKSFSNGRILGGHMRSHTSTKTEKKFSNKKLGFEDNEESGYVLRENPKKSWKFSGSKDGISKQENLCAICGKGFDSARALFGHMRHHLGRKRKGIRCKESDNGASSGSVKCKRSRMRYLIDPSSSFSGLNEFASCEIEHEVEYMAVCLMMMSRGVHNWDGFDLNAVESLDNNSASVEVKNVDYDKQIAKTENANSVCKVDTSFTNAKEVKLEFPVEFNEPEFNDEYGFSTCDIEVRSGSSDELILKPDGKQSSGGFESMKFTSSEGAKFDACDPKLRTSYCSNKMHTSGPLDAHDTIHESVEQQASIFPETGANCKLPKLKSIENLVEHEAKKSKEHECSVCFRVFSSGQALGGHKRAHMIKKSESRDQTIALQQEHSRDDSDLSLIGTLSERDQ